MTVGVAEVGAADLGSLVTDRRVVVCCGPGGVGKTTIAASVALQAARLGRRSCVVTVDPARRLADSLGLDSLGNRPTEVAGTWPGQLTAVMLDTKRTFDDLIGRYAERPEQVEAITSNRIYQSLTSALSGTQEYMAMEKLYELASSGDYDIVVVDTPPSRNALDLLDAPSRLTRLLEHRLFRALLLPTRTYLRAVGLATRALLRTISTVAGSDIVADVVTFFRAFEGMEEGIRRRAGAVRSLLGDPETAYVVVSSARLDAVAEATFMTERLRDRGIVPSALVLNRVNPQFAVSTDPELDFPAATGTDFEALVENLDELRSAARHEADTLFGLVEVAGPVPVGRVPLLASDVHDLRGVATLADHLFG